MPLNGARRRRPAPTGGYDPGDLCRGARRLLHPQRLGQLQDRRRGARIDMARSRHQRVEPAAPIASTASAPLEPVGSGGGRPGINDSSHLVK
jgi:hypothetical protein